MGRGLGEGGLQEEKRIQQLAPPHHPIFYVQDMRKALFQQPVSRLLKNVQCVGGFSAGRGGIRRLDAMRLRRSGA
jgi:hypothetical protein